MTTLLITGARGQLGTDLLAAAAVAGIDATGVGSGDLDITDADAVEKRVGALAESGSRPVVINAAAYTAVDRAETDSDRAFLVNGTGPSNVAAAAARHGAGLIHVSTDYVFPGDAKRPYGVDDPTGPKSVYGQSKLAGELAVLAAHPAAHVVRTAWVYGATGGTGNFVKTIAKLEASRPSITVVNDQRGSPTWSGDLAAGLLALAAADHPGGLLHAAGSGETSWYGFARAIFEELGADPDRVTPISSDAYPSVAPRPAYSVLSQDAWLAAGLAPLRPWREALHAAFSAQREAYLP
ncbi:MAG: dTDP-4-dehydrorhamnose reductase [Actinomycetota bacterium]|nr:dTDP-4-dehydrorhamnose reductase [Actinomycetota bacterium]